MAEKCTQIGTISKLNSEVADLSKIVKGNGNKGIYKTMIEVNQTVMTLNESVKLLRTAVSGLTKFQIEVETEIRLTASRKTNIKWLVGTIIALTGLVITLILV